MAGPGGRSGQGWPSADLHEQSQLAGLGEPLDTPAAAEKQNGDPRHRDRSPGRGRACELIDVAAGHGEPDSAHLAATGLGAWSAFAVIFSTGLHITYGKTDTSTRDFARRGPASG